MQETIIALASPVFFLLIGIELVVVRLRRRPGYRLNDALNSISLGILSQVTGVFTPLLRIGLYAWSVEHLALWQLAPSHWWVWLSGLVLYDLCYYWLHRLGHEVNILWAAHVVHHQSEQYNLSTALRQTSSGVLLGWIFYLPMAVLGYPVEVFAVVLLIDLLYQFWIHTEEIGRLGWFDRVFASPSNHRVHHAVNARYLDRNYGGILILWDRLFGSFQPELEEERPRYGTRAPLESWNPLYANVEVYWTTAQDAWRARAWRDKLVIWFARPGWRPADVTARFPKAPFSLERADFDPPIPRALQLYCLGQFVFVLAMSVHFLEMQETASVAEVAAYCLYLVVALTLLGELLQNRLWSVPLEALRLVATAIAPLVFGCWFGIAHLDVRLGAAFAAVFGASLIGLALAVRPDRRRALAPLG